MWVIMVVEGLFDYGFSECDNGCENSYVSTAPHAVIGPFPTKEAAIEHRDNRPGVFDFLDSVKQHTSKIVEITAPGDYQVE